MAKSWELTEEQRNHMQDLYVYNQFVTQQANEFEAVMKFVNNIINELVEEREVTAFTQLRARIKSQKSVLQNDPIKAVDDVFGMEIVTATEQEYEKIMERLKEVMTYKKSREFDKPNGYKAQHLAMTLKKEYIDKLPITKEELARIKFEEIPMIEFQFKTIEVMIKASIGEAAHTTYKGEDLEDVQRKYDAGEYSLGKSGIFELPTMWASEKGKMRLLDTEEVLEAMYPYLKLRKREVKRNEGEHRV